MLEKVVDLGQIEKQLHFIVDQPTVDKTISAYVREIIPKVQINGFRKGAAPPAVVRRTYKDHIDAVCSEKLISEEVAAAIRDHSLRIVGRPIAEAPEGAKHSGTYTSTGQFHFSVLADFAPQLSVTIPSLKLSERLPAVGDLANAEIARLAASQAQLELVDRPAEYTDQVSVEVDVNGTTEYLAIAISDPPEVLVSNSVLVSAVVGQTVVGTRRDGSSIHMKVCSVFSRTLPEINDDFARSCMYESMADMRQKLTDASQESVIAPLRAKLYGEILTQLIEVNPIQLPQRWIDTETAVVCKRLGMKNVPEEGSNLRRQLNDIATRNLYGNLLLDALYAAHDEISLSHDEVMAIIQGEAGKAGVSADEVLTQLKASGQYDAFMSFYERNRVIDFLISKAQEQV